jgi:tetratricopeptide (TPR) repeat protein
MMSIRIAKGEPMRALSTASLAAAVLVVATSLAGCAKINELQAMRSFKAANQAYGAHDYKAAAGEYETAIAKNPDLAYAYFYLANSYDNQYKPSRKGDAENDALLTKAVENYTTGADKLAASGKPEDKNLANLSLKYLVAAYSVDKLNDPAKAEPVLIKMIQLDPADPEAYFMLANVYEQAAEYDSAEKLLMLARDAKPADPAVYLQLAGYYNRQGQFDKTIAALEQRAEKEPTNPEAYQMIAGYYYEETNGDTRLVDAQKRDYVSKGLQAVDKAMGLKTDYAQAMTFKGLLLRQQALLEKDQAKIKELLKEAEEWGEKANGLIKKQAAGAQ